MKKLLSLLTTAALTSSSIASATAFTTNTNTKLSNIKTTKNLYGYKNAKEHIDTLNKNLYQYGSTEVKGLVKMRYYISKANLLWANYQGWSHFFRNLYGHIGFWHPEVGYNAGKLKVNTVDGRNISGYIFDKNTLATGNKYIYCYSVFASDYWAWSSEKYDFMGDIDLDSHNGSDGGMHGTYVGTLLNLANSVPTDKNGLSFQVIFNLDTNAFSYQEIDTSTIAYW